jgi:hypothetical protein
MRSDEKIRERLDQLVAMGEEVLATKQSSSGFLASDLYVDAQKAQQWATSVRSLLARVFGLSSEHYMNFLAQVRHHLTFSPVLRAQGVLRAAKDDYENGHLLELRRLVEADLFDDFLEQAEHLFSKGYHQAAAVIAGCVLEDGLRKLCGRYGVPLSSRPKLDSMNAELVKAGAFSKLVQKRITALSDLRNKAAHGEWGDFSQDDVKEMIVSVRRLLEEALA